MAYLFINPVQGNQTKKMCDINTENCPTPLLSLWGSPSRRLGNENSSLECNAQTVHFTMQ